MFNDGTQFTNGSKEMDNPSTWVNGVQTSAGKNDIGEVYLYNTTVQGDVWSFFGFTRNASNGTTAFDVEYNQRLNSSASLPTRPTRTPGDLLIQLEQDGNKKFAVTNVFRWQDSGLTDSCFAVAGFTPAAGWCPVNVGGSDFVGETSDDGFFAEGAVNLGKLVGGGTCVGDFGVMNIRSRASDEENAALKDWVQEQTVSIPGTCGHIDIEKTDSITGEPPRWCHVRDHAGPDPRRERRQRHRHRQRRRM